MHNTMAQRPYTVDIVGEGTAPVDQIWQTQNITWCDIN